MPKVQEDHVEVGVLRVNRCLRPAFGHVLHVLRCHLDNLGAVLAHVAAGAPRVVAHTRPYARVMQLDGCFRTSTTRLKRAMARVLNLVL